MDTSFFFFTFHPMMKLFPAYTGEGANHEAMFSLLKATQDFSFWAQKDLLNFPCEGWAGRLRQQS